MPALTYSTALSTTIPSASEALSVSTARRSLSGYFALSCSMAIFAEANEPLMPEDIPTYKMSSPACRAGSMYSSNLKGLTCEVLTLACFLIAP